MFTLTKIGDTPGISGGLLGLKHKGEHVCRVRHWTLASCGIASLENIPTYSTFFGEKENVDKLVEFLKGANLLFDNWKPKEFLFALSTTQIETGHIDGLIKHPLVKKLDKFTNKAHGPNDITLFRLSLQNDFPRRKKQV